MRISRRKLIPRSGTLFQDPFYYIEYGMAQLAAVQIWAAALSDQTRAVKRYRQALALGGTVPLPQFYATAGAHFAFDADTLGAAVHLIESTIAQLEPLANGWHPPVTTAPLHSLAFGIHLWIH